MRDTTLEVLFCDADGKIAICEHCGQVHSPYWAASKSAYMHTKGMGHKVRVLHGSELLKACETR